MQDRQDKAFFCPRSSNMDTTSLHQQLKVQLSWILPENHKSNSGLLSAYHNFFVRHISSTNRGETFQMGSVCQRPAKSLYEETIYCVDVVVDTGGMSWFEPHVYYGELAQSWCDEGRKKKDGVFQWLTPAQTEAFPKSTHPVDWEVPLSSVTFGTLYGLDAFVEHQKFSDRLANGTRNYRLIARFQHDQRVLYVDLHLNHRNGCGKTVSAHRFVITYPTILKVLVRKRRSVAEVFLHLKSPAILMGEAPDAEDNRPETVWWERYLSVGCDCIGCKVGVRSICGNLVVKLSMQNDHATARILGRLSQRCNLGTIIHFCPVRTVVCSPARTKAVHEGCEAMQRQLPFACAYAFKSVLLITFDVLNQIVFLSEKKFEALMELLTQRALQNPVALERALCHIATSIDAGNVVLFHRAIEATFDHFFAAPPAPLARGTCLVRSIFVTPGRLILRPAQIHFENRVLREFDAEFALRVSFRDDNLDKLSFSLHLHSSCDAILDAVVGRMMREGLSVGYRVFKFLAASPSQLRDHGVWMYAVDEHWNSASSIRSWMGRFDQIHNVAKRMARMGQCFSSTEQAVHVPESQVKMVPDVVGGMHPMSKEPYIFTDGVGMISVPLAKEVYKVLNLKEEPSAIQIRFSGSKGMLCVNPSLPDAKLLCLRPSMKKFPCSSSNYLEVIKVSAPRVVTLNRPLITILEQLGVPARVFLRLQEEMILEYTDSLVSERNAVEMLTTMAKLPLPFRSLSEAGYRLTRDPFFRSMLLAVYKNALAGLRYKTRIALPANTARNMLGVADTTGVLEYGQVFVQYTEMGSHVTQPAPKRVVTGTVLITKCPCLHPGDVRKFTAVDVPQLRHVVDCVVFPIKGPRPHPDEMAGSDLDGDEYIVTWDPRLFFPGSNCQPMNFSDRNVRHHNGEIKISHMIRFVCDYIKNDSIGVLSNAHLAWADQEPEGIHSKRCLSIAEKVSVCLDFAKNGRTAYLRPEERPIVYPDFMEKGNHKMIYRSNRALGQLYRACRSLEAAVGMVGRCHAEVSPSLAVPGWESYKESAEVAYHEYCFHLRQLLNQYGIDSEGEALACAVNSFDRYHVATTDKLNMEDLLEKLTKFIAETTRNVFFRELVAEFESEGIESAGEQTISKYRKASAWYMVAYENDAKDKPCFSFPWCVADVLGEIVKLSDPRAAERKKGNTLAMLIDDVLANNSNENDNGEAEASLNGTPIDKPTWHAFKMVQAWLEKEALVEPAANKSNGTKSNLCSNCLRAVFLDFLPTVNKQRSHPLKILPDCDAAPREGEGAGAIFVKFLRWCIDHPELPKERCQTNACAAGSYEGETQSHCLPMVALRAYSSTAVSLDLCHLGLPCNPELHELKQEIAESEPIRIPVTNLGFQKKVAKNLQEIRQLLIRWTGVEDLHISEQNETRRKYIVVSSTGRDWQRWFLEELLLQPWFPAAIEKGSLEEFLKPEAAKMK